MMIGIFSYAQNSESTYLQQEQNRLARVNTHEANIQNYIDQNISSYVLPTAIANKINTQKHEDGSNYTASEMNEMVLNTKKQNLREAYFSQNPTVKDDYQATQVSLTTSCVNSGFEDGNTIGFSLYSQNLFEPWTIFSNFHTSTSGFQIDSEIIKVVDNSIVDPHVGIPRVADTSQGSHKALRVNNANNGQNDVSRIIKNYVVGSDQNNITFKYALIFQDPQLVHGSTSLNPYYQCRLMTANGTVIFERRIIADRFNTLVFKSKDNGDIVYTDWSCESIDVSQYQGQEVVLDIIISDCGIRGHWGYAYFDDFCGSKCSAPTFGKIVLDPLGITCPLLPLNVSGSFITPTGYELESLTLHGKNIGTGEEEVTLDQYSLFGNDFRFNVSAADLFLTGSFIKQFDFNVTGTFKVIGGDSTIDLESQSANSGADVIFTNSCKICTSCGLAVSSHWLSGSSNTNWVDYLDLDGNVTRTFIPKNNCVEIITSRIITASPSVGPCLSAKTE